uniref:Uncharacterized protein n=1 Tax=Ditylenchus dipsaci TaxID=166011 RepID=A0A915DR65_9BILA
MITIAQFNIACSIAANSMVLFLAEYVRLTSPTNCLTFAVVDGRGLAPPIRTQFVVYSYYHFCIALLFLAIFCLGSRAQEKVRQENFAQL